MWDDAKKAKAVKMYQDAEPTPETSIEIVKQIAEELEETPNGVRMILSKAEVYVKKAEASGSTKTSGKTDETKTPRVSKADSLSELKSTISAAGLTPNDEIIDKLTGKQAVYFTSVIKPLIK